VTVKTGYIKVVLPTGHQESAVPAFADAAKCLGFSAAGFGIGVDGYRIQDALRTHNNVGVENNVPQDGVWSLAVKNRLAGIAPARY
jgi:hypothetical protein